LGSDQACARFGWALFYLKGVAPPDVNIKDIPGVVRSLGYSFLLVLLFLFPQIALAPKDNSWLVGHDRHSLSRHGETSS
jgi:TRAP-type mannitol/chloroaromatic compound transport system permease large subunit